ncbi:flagellar hook-associated protein 3 [Clostridium pasteurianum DSM 525 = ATCC 6013]|uniref:Flagellar hook-associated protein 3 n=1 Tax=Clostridium pasteurianum DSM 525 = ATCC 6013 TaxID=1262449 RepID=A0A0H3J9M3_CLOPA|nr:flagellar hook-associated protein FlgL [Clostridium pasteurianum]AJA47840.1 flagellar hook-associated protein 3 [Clostridium pasteurianum DSM 525 = ATCC 6013]AJA51828.1 flagellar hook-associated protein 3 [Clostridium pasteurianum DSM 525 = ATCC 6013]AOZ75131.1 flagellin [Clostridium pasteurianum DSM 525 = ATCC 6013]AOZ78926.1 flagellin [Clostridium pasteurianum]ELP59741.1 flagellar hook-associated protein 3 [Clostridium pasteurianum DSM 525 = ATCC 6013]
MRITNNMLTSNFLSDMQNNLQNMQKIQQQMTSGKVISKASDDPFIAARSMQLNTQLDANNQYNSNIKDASNWLSTTDTTLGQVGNALSRINELLVSTGNAGFSDNERQSVKDEINQVISGLSQTLNTNFDGKYIFGGSRATTKPLAAVTDSNGNTKLDYNASSAELNMIDKKLYTEISQGVTIDYSVSAQDVLEYKNGDSTEDLRNLLQNIVNHLDGKNADGSTPAEGSTSPISLLTTDDLAGIQAAANNVLKLRSEVGAKENRMKDALDNNTTESQNLTTILSKTEDIDITQKTMEYATAQTVYLASLQTSARVIQPTLLDYLR